MESFPSWFNGKSIVACPELRFNVADVQADLASVRKALTEYCQTRLSSGYTEAFFYIAHEGRFYPATTEKELLATETKEYHAYPYGRSDYDSLTRKYKAVIEKLGEELTERFHDNFMTLHETHWDSEQYKFYPVKPGETPASAMCRIKFNTV